MTDASFCLFQQGDQWRGVQSVVWLLCQASTGHTVTFSWDGKYTAYCKHTGVFNATYTDTVATDQFDPADGASFTISYDKGLYQIQRGKLEAKPGSLRITMDSSIPPQSNTVAGFCIDGVPVCQKAVSPETDFEISLEAQYGLVCRDDLSKGNVIDLEHISSSIKYFSFTKWETEKAFIFTCSNAWQEGKLEKFAIQSDGSSTLRIVAINEKGAD
jgi:hypothetical protein